MRLLQKAKPKASTAAQSQRGAAIPPWVHGNRCGGSPGLQRWSSALTSPPWTMYIQYIQHYRRKTQSILRDKHPPALVRHHRPARIHTNYAHFHNIIFRERKHLTPERIHTHIQLFDTNSETQPRILMYMWWMTIKSPISSMYGWSHNPPWLFAPVIHPPFLIYSLNLQLNLSNNKGNWNSKQRNGALLFIIIRVNR